MTNYIGCDVHKKYSVFAAVNDRGKTIRPQRVEHDRANFRSFLDTLPIGSPIAVETTGNWYWIIDEMDRVPKEDRRTKAAEITTRLVSEIAPMVQGVHFMPLGWSDVVVRVVEEMIANESKFARASGA